MLHPVSVSLWLILLFMTYSFGDVLSEHLNKAFFYYFSNGIKLFVPAIFMVYMFSDLYRYGKYRIVLYLTFIISLIVSYLFIDLTVNYNINGSYCLNGQVSPCDWNYLKLTKQGASIFLTITIVQLILLKIIQCLYTMYRKFVN